MTENPPQHEVLSPEEAARRLVQFEVGDERMIAVSLREHVLEYGSAELQIGDEVVTVWVDDK
jgi:hypothetical protein